MSISSMIKTTRNFRKAAALGAVAAVVAFTSPQAQAQDLLAWWSFNNSNNDSDLTNANGDDNARSNFGHMLDNNHAFDDGWYDADSTLFGIVPQDPTRRLLLPVQDSFTINPGALISVTDPGVGVPSLSGVGARIIADDLVGDNFASGTSDNWGSFSGTGTNRPDGGTFGGGTLSITGDGNNGSSFVIEADLGGDWEAIELTWANRGTSTGFASRIVDVSTDGVNWTQIYSDSGTLSSTFTVESASAGTLLDGASTALIRFTIDGATSTSGNNRFDNIQLLGTAATAAIPTPAAAGMGMVALCGLAVRRFGRGR